MFVDVVGVAAGVTVALWRVTGCLYGAVLVTSWLDASEHFVLSSYLLFVCSRLASSSIFSASIVFAVRSSSLSSRFRSDLAPLSCVLVSSSRVERFISSALSRRLSASKSPARFVRSPRSCSFSNSVCSALARLVSSRWTCSAWASSCRSVRSHSPVLASSSLPRAARARCASASCSRDAASDASSDVTMTSLLCSVSTWRLIVSSLSLFSCWSSSTRRLSACKHSTAYKSTCHIFVFSAF